MDTRQMSVMFLNASQLGIVCSDGSCDSPNACVCDKNYTEACDIPLCFGIKGSDPSVCNSQDSVFLQTFVNAVFNMQEKPVLFQSVSMGWVC